MTRKLRVRETGLVLSLRASVSRGSDHSPNGHSGAAPRCRGRRPRRPENYGCEKRDFALEFFEAISGVI